MTKQYLVPSGAVELVQEIKRSRFITQIAHTHGHDAVSHFISQIKSTHPQARHHCWACISSAPGDPHGSGFSDDGEPSGTAGKPILAHLTGSGLGQITAVVTRYSGGIKLGTGGLVKAYGGSVGKALLLLPTERYIPVTQIEFCYEYTLQAQVELAIKQFSGKILHSQYLTKVSLTVEISAGDEASFILMLRELSKNQIEFLTC